MESFVIQSVHHRSMTKIGVKEDFIYSNAISDVFPVGMKKVYRFVCLNRIGSDRIVDADSS